MRSLRGILIALFAGIVTVGWANLILPIPKIQQDGHLKLPWNLTTTSFYLEFNSDDFQTPVASRAIDLLSKMPVRTNKSEKGIRIKVDYQREDNPVDREIALMVEDSLIDKEQGYLLHLTDSQIVVFGFDQAGVLYAVQSLRQIISAWSAGQDIFPTKIFDYPTFLFRGVMDDISRGPLSNLDFIKHQIRRLSMLKMNVFSFYIEHVIKTSAHYSFAPDEAITLDEFEMLSNYADSFNVQLMGSFQSLGHFKQILADPQYQHLGISERMLKPADDKALKFLMEIYDELIPRFNHPVFNINGDEAYDLARGPEFKQLSEQIGEGQIYQNHIKPLLKHVKSRGKTPGLWGDVLLQYPEVIDQLPGGTAVFTWNYLKQESYDAFITPFINDRIKCIVAPGVVNSYKLWPDLAEAQANISGFAFDGWRHGAQGVMTTVWDDGGRHFFATDWYGIAVGATHSWNPEERSVPHLPEIFYNIFYQGEGPNFSAFLQNLQSFQETDRLSNLDNAILNVDFDPYRDQQVFFDTSETAIILNRAGRTLQSLKKIKMQLEEKGTSLFPSSDFDFWQFKIMELKHAMKTPLAFLEFQKLLKPADAKSPSTKDIEAAIKLSEREMEQWSLLKRQFHHLWNIENRSYWYNEAEAIYEGKISIWERIRDHALDHPGTSLASFKATSDKYFTYWLAAGPFTLETTDNIDTDFFTPVTNEKDLRPAAIDYYQSPEGDYISWKKIIETHPSTMRLTPMSASNEKSIMYTSCQIVSDKSQDVDFVLEYHGAYKIYMNGLEVPVDTTFDKNLFSGQLKVIPGRNYLLLKLQEPDQGKWEFSFRLKGQKVQGNKYRYYLNSSPP